MTQMTQTEQIIFLTTNYTNFTNDFLTRIYTI